MTRQPKKMTRRQLDALTTLVDLGGSVISPAGRCTRILVESSGIDRRSMTDLLRRLEHDGLVEREIVGKRTKRINVTKQGRKVLASQANGRNQDTQDTPTEAAPSPKQPVDQSKPEAHALPLGTQVRIVGIFIAPTGGLEYVLEHDGVRHLVAEMEVENE